MHVDVNRQNFRDTRVADPVPLALEPGLIRLAVERFAGTNGMASAYDQLVNGKADPAFDFIVSMGNSA